MPLAWTFRPIAKDEWVWQPWVCLLIDPTEAGLEFQPLDSGLCWFLQLERGHWQNSGTLLRAADSSDKKRNLDFPSLEQSPLFWDEQIPVLPIPDPRMAVSQAWWLNRAFLALLSPFHPSDVGSLRCCTENEWMPDIGTSTNLELTVHRVTTRPSLPGTVTLYTWCFSTIINSFPFHSQQCPHLGNKWYGYFNFSSVTRPILWLILTPVGMQNGFEENENVPGFAHPQSPGFLPTSWIYREP